MLKPPPVMLKPPPVCAWEEEPPAPRVGGVYCSRDIFAAGLSGLKLGSWVSRVARKSCAVEDKVYLWRMRNATARQFGGV